MRTKDLYQVLGLRPGAKKAEIERAARRLSRLHHPSLNPGDAEAARRYEEIQTAYSVLENPKLRRAYDRNGVIPGEPAREEEAADLGPRSPAEEDIYVTVALSFMEAVRGSTREIAVGARRRCDACGGRGCDGCRGTGLVPRDETIRVDIPPGVDTGSSIRVARPDEVPGHIVVSTNVGGHPFFRRLGNNVYCEVPITLPEAALGARIDIPTLTGTASLKIPPGTQSGQKLRLHERGIPALIGGGHGDLYVEVRVVTPEVLDDRVRKSLRELSKSLQAAGHDPRAHVAELGRREP